MILIDGEVGDTVDVHDRGLAYGDGLFETIALCRHRLLGLERHLARLARDAARLGIVPPDRALLLQDVERVCARRAEAVIKVILTRGSGARGYRAPAQAAPRRIVMSSPWPGAAAPAGEGRAWLCRHPVSSNPVTAGIKHLNRLDQVLASREWSVPAYREGLMLDSDGLLIEGTRSNVFLIRDDVLITPALERAGVAGIVRGAVLDAAAHLGIRSEVRAVPVHELALAQTLFVTNSILGICSIAALDGAVEARYTAHRHVAALTATLLERALIA